MTQTIVNFLTPQALDSNGVPITYTISQRVFDFEISGDAQSYYLSQMAALQAAFGAINTSDPNANDALIVQISKIINELNEWSQLKFAESGNTDQSYEVNGNVITVITQSGGTPLQIPQIEVNGVLQMVGGQPQSAFDYFAANPGDKNPLFTPSGSSPPLTSTMDRYMAESLDKLLRTIRSATSPTAPSGTPPWDVILSNPTTTAQVTDAMRYAVIGLTSVTTKDVYGLDAVLARAVSTANQARIIGDATTGSQSIQQLLMVDYVSRGNELLFNEMSLLRDAIDINQTALSYLNSLQDLMNQKDPQKFILQLQDLNNVHTATSPDLQAIYDTFEQNTYNTALATISKIADDTPATLQAYLDSLATGAAPANPSQDPIARGAFEDLSNAMGSVFTYSQQMIKTNLQYVIDQLNAKAGAGEATSLTIPLNTILQDFNRVTSINDWIQDAASGSEGDNQRHINNAIVASQSFNDTQRENLRSVMFTFEEFYKSATALLSRLTQLIEKMAGAIAR